MFVQSPCHTWDQSISMQPPLLWEQMGGLVDIGLIA